MVSIYLRNGGGDRTMMGFGGYGYSGNMMGSFGSLGFLTWILLVVFLILGIIYFWKGINKK